jgi:rhamnulose-1-phosphate aldolase
MKRIDDAPFVADMVKAANDMWLKGWDERNGGNISYRLAANDVREYGLCPAAAGAEVSSSRAGIPLAVPRPELAGEVFIITGSGKYFRNVILDPADTLGIIRLDGTGSSWQLLWGFSGGACPTSELAAHLMSHAARRAVSGDRDRVLIHTHATNLLALTYRYEASTEVFTRKLWEMCTECLVVFPDGVGVLPWLVPGTDEIGMATAALMKKHRLVIWPFHGIVGCGATLDETFGLIDTAEKAAEILVKVDSMGGLKYGMSEKNLTDLANRFGVTPMEGVIGKI